MGEELLTIQDLADRHKVAVGTIYQHRCKGYGPPSLLIGGAVRYRLADVEAWEAEQLTDPTDPAA
jgi:hypothetical protein